MPPACPVVGLSEGLLLAHPGLALLRPDPPQAQSVPLGNSSINSPRVGVLGQPFMISSSREPAPHSKPFMNVTPPGLAGSPLCPVPSLCPFAPSPSPSPECLQDLGQYVLLLLNGPLALGAAAFVPYSKRAMSAWRCALARGCEVEGAPYRCASSHGKPLFALHRKRGLSPRCPHGFQEDS